MLLQVPVLALIAMLLAIRRFGDGGSHGDAIDAEPIDDEAEPPEGAPWPGVQEIEIGLGQVGELPNSIDAAPENGTGYWRVAFTLGSDVEAENCALVGDFNGWSADREPMQRAADGRWRAEVLLGGGVHRYKFCLDGTHWMADPANDEAEDDGFEASNSVLRLGPLGHPDALDADFGNGEIRTDALEHDPRQPLYIHRLKGDRLRVRYRTLADDVEGVRILLRDGRNIVMEPVRSPAPFQFWQVDVDLPREPTEYTFGLEDKTVCLCDPRLHVLDPKGLPILLTPEWAKDAVWYQIFPERFRNGDPSNDPETVRPWTSDWDVPAEWEGADGQTFWEFYVYQRMYGGDIAGIESKLDYLVELGITAIYLNPVFQAHGSHKYNATDFRHIDTGLGAGEDYEQAVAGEDLLDPSTWTWTPSDLLFLDFLKACKSRGLRVVLDAVFNHVGVQHPAFRDVQKSGQASRYADWFKVKSWEPFEYSGWAGFGDLPVFAKTKTGLASEAVKEHLFAITRRWMDPDGDGDPRDGIDGWRLDVPMELPAPFWEEWRTLVKSINPDAYIAGEIWHRADEWLGGRHFDAVMNYRFADPLVAWIGNLDHKVSASELDRRLLELRMAYPDEATYALMNLVDSHDTDRIASMLLNRDRPYERSNQIQRRDDYNSGRPHEVHFRRMRLIMLAQMTYLGAPMIYYGDEVGMWGADDPTNRKPMVWQDLQPYENPGENHVLEDHLAFYREAIALRRGHVALRTGTFRTVLADDEQDLWVFERELGDEVLLVALNASSEASGFELPAPAAGAWEAVLGAAPEGATDSAAQAQVGPIAGRVWTRRTARG